MSRMSFRVIAISATMLLSCAATHAQADGMPFGNVKPKPILTPLDQALDEIQTQEAPAAAVAPAPEPAVMPAPVPESRVVEVQPNTSYFGLSVGMYDPFSHGEQATSFNLEWQPGVKIAGFLQPLFGAMATTSGAMMGYGGVGVPFNVTDNIFIMPSVSVGAYKEGAGYDLGQTLAFRVGTEVAYQFEDKSRIGINAHVLTNGRSFDREDRTEVISLVYTTPTDILSGRSRKADLPGAAAMTAPTLNSAPTN